MKLGHLLAALPSLFLALAAQAVPLRLVAGHDLQIPGTNDVYTDLGAFSISSTGDVVFRAQGGGARHVLYERDAGHAIVAARQGDPVPGHVTSFSLEDPFDATTMLIGTHFSS